MAKPHRKRSFRGRRTHTNNDNLTRGHTISRATARELPLRHGLLDDTWASLSGSGLSADTIEQAHITDGGNADTAELLARFKVLKGYHIPYFGYDGRPTGHFRVRILKDGTTRPDAGQKYVQPRNSGNRVYIPPLFEHESWLRDPQVPVFITEGEKKALAGAQAGQVTLGLGGVYSWRSKVFKFPRSKVRMEEGASFRQVVLSAPDAQALQDEIAPDLTEPTWVHRTVYIVFDSDLVSNLKVAQAAFDFAQWLEQQGADAYLLPLPAAPSGAKVGLDDWLLAEPAAGGLLADDAWLAEHTIKALPPDPLNWLGGQLNDKKLTRPVALTVASTLLRLLDTRGERYRDGAGNYYYFDAESKALHEFRMDQLPRLRETTFGGLLEREYGLGTADATVMSRFADKFVQDTDVIAPRRVTAAQNDVMYWQMNDSTMARIDADGVAFVDNGTDGILMLADAVSPLAIDEVRQAFQDKATMSARGNDLRWHEAIATLRLESMPGLLLAQTRALLANLFYMSPFINRWHGVNLPLEVAVAEPGSGKTFLYNLRKGILSGRPQLTGLPDDFKGWVASIAATGGLWVCDNLGGIRGDYWHRLSDEFARLITDPEPSVDLRQLYTTSSLSRIPVQVAFAITAIKNPFNSPDILQRSLIYELNAIPSGERDGSWYSKRMAERPQWVAEQLGVLRRFATLATTGWSTAFNSGYRLAGFEQALGFMGEATGLPMEKVIVQLPKTVAGTVAHFDPVIEALAAFAAEWQRPIANLRDVINWVEGDMDERFSNIRTFDNVITLGKYLSAHKYDISQSTGIELVKLGPQTTLKVHR